MERFVSPCSIGFVCLRCPRDQRDDGLVLVEPCVCRSALVMPYICIQGFGIGRVVGSIRLFLMIRLR